MDLTSNDRIADLAEYTLDVPEWEEGETYEEREQRKAAAALDRVYAKAVARPAPAHGQPSTTL